MAFRVVCRIFPGSGGERCSLQWTGDGRPPFRPSRPGIGGRPTRPPIITPALPLPQPPVPTPPTFPQPKPIPQGQRVPTSRPPFGTQPAANDPIFRRGASIILQRAGLILGRILGPVGLGAIATDVFTRISERLLDIRLEDLLAAEISRARRGRKAQERDSREVIVRDPPILSPPATPKIPKTVPKLPPGRIEIFEDLPLDLPGFPSQLPNFPGSPGGPRTPTQPRPRPRTDPRRQPRPESPRTPRPKAPPSGNPLIRVLPFGFPLPGTGGVTLPLGSPAPIPSIRLTPSSPGVPSSPSVPVPVGSIIPAPGAGTQPRRATRRKCEEVKRRRRRKGKCREGFFEELPGKTRYTTWRTVDCVTRKPVRKRPKLKIVKRTI